MKAVFFGFSLFCPISFNTSEMLLPRQILTEIFWLVCFLFSCLQGNRAIAEIQFADYIYPAFDQVKNSLSLLYLLMIVIYIASVCLVPWQDADP
jgi:hypothetical protein